MWAHVAAGYLAVGLVNALAFGLRGGFSPLRQTYGAEHAFFVFGWIVQLVFRLCVLLSSAGEWFYLRVLAGERDR